MDRLGELDALYDEVHAAYRRADPELVRRRTVPEVLRSRVLLLGQALGRDTQRLSGLPYCHPPPERPRLSRGGKVLDDFLAMFGYTILAGGSRQYAYHTDLVHFFPGRRVSGSGDLKPLAQEIARNRRWFEAEVRLLQPSIVIALGGLAASEFLEHYARRRINRLGDVAGIPSRSQVAGFALQFIAVHHPSGAFQHPSSRETYQQAAAHVQRILAS